METIMTRYGFGDSWFDAETREVRLDQQPIEALKPKNAEVLEFLIQKRDQVVTRDMFFEVIWEDVSVTEQALNKIINELRNSLNDRARNSRFIKTYTKKGYKWVWEPTTILASDPPRSPQDRPRPRRKILWAGFGLITLAIIVMVLRLNRSTPDPKSEPLFVALMPFVNATGDAEKQWIEDGLRDLVARTLESSTPLEIIEFRDVRDALTVIDYHAGQALEEEDVRHLRRLIGFDHLIWTSIDQPDRYRLRYQIWQDAQAMDAEVSSESLLQVAQLMAFSLTNKLNIDAPRMGLGPKLSANEYVNVSYAKEVQFLEHGDVLKAENHFKVCLDHEPNMIWAKLQLGTAYRMQDKPDRARNTLTELLEQARTLTNPRLEADVLRNLGLLERRMGNWEEAFSLTQQSHRLYQSLHYLQGELITSAQLATIEARIGNLDAAESRIRDSYARAKTLGNKYVTYSTAIKLATILSLQGAYDRAEPIYHEALDLVLELKDRRNQASILENLGNIYLSRDQYERARQSYQRALDINRDTFNHRSIASCIQNLGAILLMEERYHDAHSFFVRALNLSREVGDRFLENQILYNLGETKLNAGQFSEAESYLREAQDLAASQQNGSLRADVTIRLALLYAIEERDTLADAQLEEVEEHDRERAAYHFVLALRAYQQGRFEDAFEAHSKAKALAGADWSSLDEERLMTYQMAVQDRRAVTLSAVQHIPDF